MDGWVDEMSAARWTNEEAVTERVRTICLQVKLRQRDDWRNYTRCSLLLVCSTVQRL